MKTPTSSEKLTVRSSTDELLVVDEWTERIAREMGYSNSDVGDFAICVTEAVNNAILHAHHRDESKTIYIHFDRMPDGLQVRVCDEGEGFDYKALLDPTLPENIMKEGGRGIHVIRHLMDKLEIRPCKTGTEIIMWKRKGAK